MQARAAAATTTALLGAAVLVLPTTSAQAATDTDQPLVIAHRGASAYAPENTLAAIDKAADLGFRWVENDVQRTKDGQLVVVHDDSLNRTTDVEEVFPDRAPWKVKDFTAAEIARLDAGSWFSPRFAGARVPTLKQYMNRVSTQSPETRPGDQESRALPRHRAGDPEGPQQRGLAGTEPRTEQAGRPEFQRGQHSDRARAAARRQDGLPGHAVGR